MNKEIEELSRWTQCHPRSGMATGPNTEGEYVKYSDVVALLEKERARIAEEVQKNKFCDQWGEEAIYLVNLKKIINRKE